MSKRDRLEWPATWTRTPAQKREVSRFQCDSVGEAMERLTDEITKLVGRDGRWQLSSNLDLKLDGRPYANQSEPNDPGVALYFTLNDREHVLASDKWTSAIDNIVALAKHIAALRGQERWGVGSIEQAFAGYAALPAPKFALHPSEWRQIFSVGKNASWEEVDKAFKRLALEHHPDASGDAQRMMHLNAARDEARRALGK